MATTETTETAIPVLEPTPRQWWAEQGGADHTESWFDIRARGPYRLDDDSVVTIDRDVAMVYGGQETGRATAELIVRAVNAHEALVEAVRATLEYWELAGFAECEPGCECIVQEMQAALALGTRATPHPSAKEA